MLTRGRDILISYCARRLIATRFVSRHPSFVYIDMINNYRHNTP
jgi:hypothetical protein